MLGLVIGFSNQIFCPDKKPTWANGKIKVLGVWFGGDQQKNLRINYDREKIRNVKNFSLFLEKISCLGLTGKEGDI